MAEQIFPTKGNLIACKKNLTLAKLGFDLLDRKRNVLMREMMKLIDEAAGMQRAIGDTFIKAYKALESANITLGIEHALEGAVPEEKGFSVTGHSIMGVDLPTGHLASRPLYPYYGFSGSNAQLDYAYVCFDKVKQLCAQLAGIENSVYRLAMAIKKTQRRANMLENVVIPRLEYRSSRITKEDVRSLFPAAAFTERKTTVSCKSHRPRRRIPRLPGAMAFITCGTDVCAFCPEKFE